MEREKERKWESKRFLFSGIPASTTATTATTLAQHRLLAPSLSPLLGLPPPSTSFCRRRCCPPHSFLPPPSYKNQCIACAGTSAKRIVILCRHRSFFHITTISSTSAGCSENKKVTFSSYSTDIIRYRDSDITRSISPLTTIIHDGIWK